MSKTKKPRKAYRPRQVIANPVLYAIEGATKLNPVEVRRVIANVMNAFDQFRQGNDPVWQWRVMADALNVAESLSDIGICSDADSLQVILDAQQVLAQVAEQHAASGSWTLRPAAMQALRDGIERHDIQLQHCSMREYERALHNTRVRIEAGRRGQSSRGIINVGDIGRQAERACT